VIGGSEDKSDFLISPNCISRFGMRLRGFIRRLLLRILSSELRET